MHEAKRILLNNLNNTQTIKDLSRNIGVNENKVKDGFKEVHNQTIYKCVFEYKIESVHKYLLDTKNVTKVALHCDYEYVSYFTKAFKGKYGMRPLEYRVRASEPLV